ncbi:MAG TPA: DUF11 domain-containing protein [Thermoanaerobaculia bacterium]|nr:DUF11 domain-containing protein [Thermoanaerobaculia bacterium]
MRWILLSGVLLLVAATSLMALPPEEEWPPVSEPSQDVSARSDGPLALLYDQTDDGTGNGVPDQDFEAAFDAYDCEAADDFAVTSSGVWEIDRVATQGIRSGSGVPTAVDVTFYANAPGGGNPDLPGAVVCAYPGLLPESSPSLIVELPTPCVLPPGVYWLGIQARQAFTSGQHFWSKRAAQSASEAVWRNPGDGFGTGCTGFAPQQTVCGLSGGRDLLFQIYGRVPQADLAIAKTGVEQAPGRVTFTLTVGNAGPDEATGVVVTDELPAELLYVSDTCQGTPGSPWSWQVGSLAAGAEATCTLTAAVLTPGAVVNSARVAGQQVDPGADDDSAEAPLVVTGNDSVVAIPTLGPAGLAVLAAVLALGALLLVRRPGG